MQVHLNSRLNHFKELILCLKSVTPKSSSLPSAKQKVVKKQVSHIRLTYSNNDFSSKPSQKPVQAQIILSDELVSQENHHPALIEDPLWKRVCADLIKMLGAKVMGSFLTVKLEDCRLDDLSGQDKIAYIHCLTEDTAQFLAEYVFVILESLRRYFPALKEIRINHEGDAHGSVASGKRG